MRRSMRECPRPLTAFVRRPRSLPNMASEGTPLGIVPPERIGFIGLGNMGAPMARRLAAAGYRLAVADAAAAAVERFRAQAACEVPATLKEIGATCRVVITMLPDGQVVRKVLMGEAGVVAGLTASG